MIGVPLTGRHHMKQVAASPLKVFGGMLAEFDDAPTMAYQDTAVSVQIIAA
jgi:hypothetical protein